MEDLIAQFLANGGEVKKVGTGARTLTEKQIKSAIGYEPEVVVKTTTIFEVQFTQETGEDACVHIEAATAQEAWDTASDDYPEWRVNSVEKAGSRAARIALGMERRMANDEWDLH